MIRFVLLLLLGIFGDDGETRKVSGDHDIPDLGGDGFVFYGAHVDNATREESVEENGDSTWNEKLQFCTSKKLLI